MKKTVFLLFVLLTLFVNAQELFVATCNIRNKNTSDSLKGNAWVNRCPRICGQINFEQPAVFGAQEVLFTQLQDMLSMLDNYDYIGVGRDDGDKQGEYSAIFYKKDKVEKINEGWFWLNETPDKAVKGWDAACVRICTWGQFKERISGEEFFFFTLHMDHVGIKARMESAKLIVRKIKEIANGKKVIVTGDFNVDQTNEIYSVFTQSGLLKDSYECARFCFAENGTFNSFDPDLKTASRIDHVFVSPSFEVDNYAVMTDCYWMPTDNGNNKSIKGHDAPQEINFQKYIRRLPSDHYPVFVKLKF